MEYKTLNLKEFMPTVDQALKMIEIEIEISKKEGIKVLKVIHGYGSSGVGGEIKKALKNWSKIEKRKNLFVEFIRGEEFLNEYKMKEVKKICPEIIGDMDLFHANAGLSLIVIQK